MKRTIVAVLATAAMSTLAVGAAAGPAFADCPDNTFCLYQTHDYQGREYTFTFAGLDYLECRELEGVDNDANAMRNYRNHDVMLFEFHGCWGDPYLAKANSYDSNFGDNNFSNKASSLAKV